MVDTPLEFLACQQITDPLTIRLPASLPAPDPDVTNALKFVIDDARSLATACTALTEPPVEAQKKAIDAVDDAAEQLGTDMQALGTIMMRNGDLLRSAAKGG